MDTQISDVYGNRVRVRVCGLCWRGSDLLLVNHRGLSVGDFWAPPGGGLEFGESAQERLQKEFREETGLIITPGRFLFACEFIQRPLHAIELFFEVVATDGTLQKGDDPELGIIEAVTFMTPEEISAVPEQCRHGIFGLVKSSHELTKLTGFFRI
jgi:8-oxo-dGTP diphosphatase